MTAWMSKAGLLVRKQIEHVDKGHFGWYHLARAYLLGAPTAMHTGRGIACCPSTGRQYRCCLHVLC